MPPVARLPPHAFTLRQLQYAVAVADALSFRRAAERCRVSQPALSAQLRALEDGLGVALFERDRRHVLLTEAGRELIARARRVLLEADDLAQAALRVGDPLAGTLRVGVIPTVSPYLLPAIAPALRTAFPALTLAWLEDKTAALVAGLESGGIDAALLALPADVGDAARALVAEDPFVLATAREHPLGRAPGPASTADLRDESVLLLDDGHCLREHALAYCSSARARELEYRATSLATLVQMVAAGAGVTLLPALAVPTETARARLAIRPFRAPVPHRTLALVWRRRSPLEDALTRLAAVVRESYPRLELAPGEGALTTRTPPALRRPGRGRSRPGTSASRR